MSRLSISECIRQSGISRTHFYGKYINEGLITVNEHKGKKYIDSSELVRVFGDDLQVNNQKEQEKDNTLQTEITLAVQAEQIKHLKEQLTESKEREQEHKERERFYRDQIKLLEAPKNRPNAITSWWRSLGEKE